MGSLERRWNYELGQRDARIAELEAQVERLKAQVELHMNGAARVASRAQKAEAQRDRLAEALRPFVKRETYWRTRMESSSLHLPVRTDCLVVTDDELEAARAALAELEEKR